MNRKDESSIILLINKLQKSMINPSADGMKAKRFHEF